MKNEKLLQAIGQIDDSVIMEAAPKAKATKKRNWVKWSAIAACAVVMLSIVFIPQLFINTEVEPTPGDLRPMIFVNDTLYFDKGTVYQNKLDGFMFIGEVISTVSPNEIPNENLQANYISVGSEVYQYGDSVIIHVNNIYSEYQKAEDTP